MSKQKKKRNKQYTGADAAMVKPVITRLSAADRSKPAQWWFDNKKVAKPVLITVGVVIFVVLMIIQIVRIAGGAV